MSKIRYPYWKEVAGASDKVCFNKLQNDIAPISSAHADVRTGQLLASAVFHGALLDRSYWQRWIEGAFTNAWLIGDVAWVDMTPLVPGGQGPDSQPRRWFADPITSLLMVHYHADQVSPSVLENFFRDILNLTLDAALVNLNKKRSNEPGLDLGDSTSKRKIAFQITSRSDPAKIKDTLTKIKKAQLGAFQEFFVLVIGERRKSYAIDANLSAKCHGFTEANILGITDLCRLIMDTNIETIRAIQQKLQQERREIRIELEPEIGGTFETDTVDLFERRPSITRSDATIFYASDAASGMFGSADEAAAALNGFIDRLEPLPRLSRGMLGWMVDESDHRYSRSDYCVVNADLVRRKYPEVQELRVDTRLLEAWDFLSYDDDQDGKSPRFSFFFPGADHDWFAEAFMNFVKEKGLSVSSLFQTMNFSPFGPPPATDAPTSKPPKREKRRELKLSGAQRALRGP